MPEGRSLMGDIMAQGASEEMSAISTLFDTTDFQRLKMISEIPPSLMYALTVMGTLQRRYKSKVLQQWLEEFLSMQKSRDRQGIIEWVEMVLGVRRVEKGSQE